MRRYRVMSLMPAIVDDALDGRDMAVCAEVGGMFHVLTDDGRLHLRVTVDGGEAVADVIGDDSEPKNRHVLILPGMTEQEFTKTMTAFIEQVMMDELVDELEGDLDAADDPPGSDWGDV